MATAVCLVALGGSSAGSDASDCHSVLGVRRGASDTELKKAYRREALRWHPDKNSSPDAEEKFRTASSCYEMLSQPGGAAAAGIRQGGGSGMATFDRDRAFRTFEDLFGDVHRRWKPGMTVSGTIASGGRKVKITIHPDGSTEEHESKSSGTRDNYSTLYSSDGHHTVVQFSGSFADLLSETLLSWFPLPAALASLVGLFLSTLCNPVVCCGIFAYCCCFRRPHKLHVQ